MTDIIHKILEMKECYYAQGLSSENLTIYLQPDKYRELLACINSNYILVKDSQLDPSKDKLIVFGVNIERWEDK